MIPKMPKPLPRECRLDMIDSLEFLEQKKRERRVELYREQVMRLMDARARIVKLLPDNLLMNGATLDKTERGWMLTIPGHKNVYPELKYAGDGGEDGYSLMYNVGSRIYHNFYDALIAAEIKPKPKLSLWKRLAMSISGFEATND
jgi:hypothetical protein